MDVLSPELLIYLALITFAAYAVYGLTGFGNVAIALPVMLFFMPLHTAIPITMLHGLFAGSTVGIAKRRHADLGELRLLAPFVVIGLVLGATILVYVPEKYLLYLLGLFLVCYSCWSLLSPSVSKQIARGWAAPLGVIGGIFSATFGTGGVLYMVFLVGRIRDKESLRATSNLIVFAVAVARLLLLLSTGFLTRDHVLLLTALLLPFVFLGLYAGNHLHSRVSLQRILQAIWLILIAAGINVIRQGLTR